MSLRNEKDTIRILKGGGNIYTLDIIYLHIICSVISVARGGLSYYSTIMLPNTLLKVQGQMTNIHSTRTAMIFNPPQHLPGHLCRGEREIKVNLHYGLYYTNKGDIAMTRQINLLCLKAHHKNTQYYTY